MARTDTFQNWATDVADSIREKTGKTDKIPAAEFDTEITAIQTKEDLDAELTVQNEEIAEQEVSIEDIKQAINGKSAYKAKYSPRIIRFDGCTSTDMKDELEILDTSKLTSMSYMFNECKNVTELDLSKFDTRNVTNMYRMFYYCESLTELDLSNFDTSNVTNMTDIFGTCGNLITLNLDNFDTSNVTNMYGMFNFCKKLPIINVSHFNTSKVTSMTRMFYYCESLTELDLSNFDTSNVTSMGYMFQGCSKLKKLDIRGFTFSKVNSYTFIFDGIPADCEIIVKDDTAKAWVLARKNTLTNVKTIAELEG